MSLADQIQRRIDELLADSSKKNSEEHKIASSLNALPINPEWSGYTAIRPDGPFLFFGDDGSIENYVEPEWRLIALISGSKKYPELESLLPRRTTDASDCIDCNGTGKAIIEGQPFDSLICGKCFGLGWVDKYIKALVEQARTRFKPLATN